LASIISTDEVKKIKDKASAMRMYAIQAKDGELAADTSEFRDRAERRLGELIDEERKAGRLAKGTRGSKVKGARVACGPTLKAQGIDKHLADRSRTNMARWRF
jgi:hypothetical protein